MKVLFAVHDEKVSSSIVKKYQREYKEIISYKNVYYFNAILKELQKDKTYDRVVISEDLEPFANNNYDTIDKFIFEKLDKISDEATNMQGDNIEIILICSDRRSKSDEMFIKFFGIGVYNALIGTDRTIENVCKLINQPRTKKDAKIYYKIESSGVNYQAENENNVSEVEIENIIRHFERLGKNEEQYIISFNNVVSQYTDNQLKIIIKYLPMRVKAVLEEKSPKYQELSTFSKKSNAAMNTKNGASKKAKKQEAIEVQMLDNETNKLNITRPIVIPSGIKKIEPKKIEPKKIEPKKIIQKQSDVKNEIDINDIYENTESQTQKEKLKKESTLEKIEKPEKEIVNEENLKQNNIQEEPVKKRRGRPKKNIIEQVPEEKTIEVEPIKEEKVDIEITEPVEIEEKPKKRRGRPKKNATVEEPIKEEKVKSSEDDIDLFSIEQNKDEEDNVDLFRYG